MATTICKLSYKYTNIIFKKHFSFNSHPHSHYNKRRISQHSSSKMIIKMPSTSFLCSPIQYFDPFPRTQIIKPNPNRKTRIAVHAAKREGHDPDFSGSRVDEGLIILRKRIHEMKMSESNYEAPSEWMDWEKQFYATYAATICDAMGHLQSYLMETRPSLALGMVALIAISVPISTALVMYNLLGLIKGVLDGIHLS